MSNAEGTNHTASLPPELIYRIINHIYHDRDSLHEFSACTAISQIWHDVRLPFLYQDVELPASSILGLNVKDRTVHRMDALIELVEMHTVAGGHDDSLSVSLDGPLSHVRTLLISGAAIVAPAFSRLADLLEMQSRRIVLLKVYAQPVNPFSGEVLWDVIDQRQRDALYKLLGFQSAIYITAGTLPVAMWGFSSSLRNINLLGMDYADSDDEDNDMRRVPFTPTQLPGANGEIATGVHYAPLTCLELRDDTIPFLLQEHPQLFNRLETIILQIHSNNVGAMRDVFLATQSTVTSGRITFKSRGEPYDTGETGWPPCILSDFPGKTLHVEFDLCLTWKEEITLCLRKTFASLPLHTLSELSLEMCVGVTTTRIRSFYNASWPNIIPDFLRDLDGAFAPYVHDGCGSVLLGQLTLRRLKVAFRGFGCEGRFPKSTCQFGRGGLEIVTPQNAPIIPSISQLVDMGILDFAAVVYTCGPAHPIRMYPCNDGDVSETVLARALPIVFGCYCTVRPPDSPP